MRNLIIFNIKKIRQRSWQTLSALLTLILNEALDCKREKFMPKAFLSIRGLRVLELLLYHSNDDKISKCFSIDTICNVLAKTQDYMSSCDKLSFQQILRCLVKYLLRVLKFRLEAERNQIKLQVIYSVLQKGFQKLAFLFNHSLFF